MDGQTYDNVGGKRRNSGSYIASPRNFGESSINEEKRREKERERERERERSERMREEDEETTPSKFDPERTPRRIFRDVKIKARVLQVYTRVCIRVNEALPRADKLHSYIYTIVRMS